MNKVILRSNGSIASNGKIVETDPLIFLSSQVELEKGYTLRSYFRMIRKYPTLSKLNVFFSSYMEQYVASPPSDCSYDGFDYLAFRKTVEMIGFPGEPRLEIYNSLHGVHGTETFEIKFVGLERLLDMPLKLGKLKHVVFGDNVDVFEFDTVFSLFEFIEGIIWELSFHGTPAACELRR